MCDSLTALLAGEGYEVVGFQRVGGGHRGDPHSRKSIWSSPTSRCRRWTGSNILKPVKQIDEGIPVILLTGYASLDSAIDAISRGAYDYLLKPVEFNRSRAGGPSRAGATRTPNWRAFGWSRSCTSPT